MVIDTRIAITLRGEGTLISRRNSQENLELWKCLFLYLGVLHKYIPLVKIKLAAQS